MPTTAREQRPQPSMHEEWHEAILPQAVRGREEPCAARCAPHPAAGTLTAGRVREVVEDEAEAPVVAHGDQRRAVSAARGHWTLCLVLDSTCADPHNEFPLQDEVRTALHMA